MFWKLSQALQRLLLYFVAIWILGMAYILGDMASQHVPSELAAFHPDWPWPVIFQVGVYLLFAMLATEMVLLLIEKLRQSNERLEMQKSIFENFSTHNPFGVLTFSDQGKLLSCNKSAEKIFGAALPSEYCLASDEAFQKTGHLRRIKNVFAGRVVELGEINYDTGLLRHVQVPPKKVTFRATFFPVLEKDQTVNNIVGIYEDVTDKVKLQTQLTRAQRMESIGTLAGGIAHDFNNILGGMLGNLSLLKPKIPSDSPLMKYVTTIENSVHRAAQLTRQLLTFVRGDIPEMKPASVNTCVENVVHLIESSFDKKYQIVHELETQPLTVECDAGQIEQAILNLCLNARDAMPGGGRILLATRTVFVKEKGGAEGLPADLPIGAYAALTVSDTGCGMDEETLKRIFEPFFTTKAPGKGTGLGLSMVFGIIKNHGGYVDVQSRVGRGTTFFLYLKATLKHAVAEKPKEEKKVEGGKECVLLVDDEEVIREFAAETLRDKGYFVITAEDGEQAINIYRNRPCEIDVVVSDMVMPKASGRTVFSTLRSIKPDIKFIFSSGYTDSDVLQDAVKSGQVQFIQKPYTGEELSKLVRRTLDEGGNGHKAAAPKLPPVEMAASRGASVLTPVGVPVETR